MRTFEVMVKFRVVADSESGAASTVQDVLDDVETMYIVKETIETVKEV
jgi:hypothetical protein